MGGSAPRCKIKKRGEGILFALFPGPRHHLGPGVGNNSITKNDAVPTAVSSPSSAAVTSGR